MFSRLAAAANSLRIQAIVLRLTRLSVALPSVDYVALLLLIFVLRTQHTLLPVLLPLLALALSRKFPKVTLR